MFKPKIFTALIFGLMMLSTPVMAQQPTPDALDTKAEVPRGLPVPPSFSNMAEALLPTVVNVSTTQARPGVSL